MNSWWPNASEAVGSPGGRAKHAIDNLAADFVQRAAVLQDPPGVDVHVLAQTSIGRRIGADLDHGRDGRADHRAASGGK